MVSLSSLSSSSSSSSSRRCGDWRGGSPVSGGGGGGDLGAVVVGVTCRAVVVVVMVAVAVTMAGIPGGGYSGVASQSTASDVSREMPLALTRSGQPDGNDPTHPPDMTLDHGCCRGTLGYASASHVMPYPCAKSGCCNGSETVAIIPVDEALGFQFVCMPWTSIKPLCYQAGSVVYSTNQDPDHVPRVCCSGARFSVLLNQWYAAMTIKCVDQSQRDASAGAGR
ncbi:uncharacterized protein LOC143298287 [Babylonia areolata]|uniref:uncharacterized protein LOC143298287 n=1 Tax=Babylonia areolata TaxID=304850 RepID=UPI003FD2479C